MLNSPYLSPPAEFLVYGDTTSTNTIDPKRLTAPIPFSDSEDVSKSTTVSSLPDCDDIKKELNDEDYGFSKFAAERDAARSEIELDEDSRLLMSEEGKKLSSKERRQLRNKVSARNFRERRKEYITHLESLVSKHQNEANVYRSQVEELKHEKDELASELARLKISISAALESNKLAAQPNQGLSTLVRGPLRSVTPTRELSLIPTLTKDVNPYSANANFNVDWPLSNMASPSSGSFEFSLHNYTSVFSASSISQASTFSEKELAGKAGLGESDMTNPSDCLSTFDRVLTSILGENWNMTAISANA